MPKVFMDQEYPLQCDGIDGWLCSPSYPKDCSTSKWMPQLGEPQKSKGVFIKEVQWGSVQAWPEGAGVMKTCTLVFNSSPDEVEMNARKIAMESFRERLIENISVIWGEDFRQERKAESINVHNAGLYGVYYPDSEGKSKLAVPEKENISIDVFIGKRSIREDAMLQAVKFTSEGWTPKLPFIYLLEAEFAKHHKQYREVVLDSATTLEILFG